MRLAAPFGDAKKVEPYGGVRIGKDACDPRVGAPHVDAELLVELARERPDGRLAGLELPAREFPVAGIDFPRRPLRQQERAVAALDHRRRDFDHFSVSWNAGLPNPSRTGKPLARFSSRVAAPLAAPLRAPPPSPSRRSRTSSANARRCGDTRPGRRDRT